MINIKEISNQQNIAGGGKSLRPTQGSTCKS